MVTATETENTNRAAAWLLLGVLGGLGLDLCAKEILRSYSLLEFILVRSGVAIVIMLAIAPRFGGYAALRTRRAGWHLLRAICAIGAMYGFFYGLAHMPLINALTLGYTAPLMVTALAAIFLGEPVGARRWSAVIVGFGGVLIMLRPGGGEVSLAAVAVLAAAFFYACQAITARHLGATETTLSLMFYVVAGPFVTTIGLIDRADWIPPDLAGWSLMICAASCSVVAWVGFVNGYRAASPATLAPLEYTALVGGALAGYVFWDEVPDTWVVVGATVIVASGVFVMRRAR